MGIEVDGKMFETDEEGYLENLSDWDPALAAAMAEATSRVSSFLSSMMAARVLVRSEKA